MELPQPFQKSVNFYLIPLIEWVSYNVKFAKRIKPKTGQTHSVVEALYFELV